MSQPSMFLRAPAVLCHLTFSSLWNVPSASASFSGRLEIIIEA